MKDQKSSRLFGSLSGYKKPHREIEVKILEINLKELRKKLEALGAKKFFEGEVDALLFDTLDGRMKKSHQTLRLRKAGDRVELCFKSKNESKEFKIMDEFEVLTSDFDTTKKILESVGFICTHQSKKHRECYRCGKIKFDIDTYPNIPTYLEIEAPTEAEVKEYVEKLGYTMQQATNLSALGVEEYYQKK